MSIYQKSALFLAMLALPLACMAQVSTQNVEDSVHNLSIYGPGQLKSTTEEGVCIFCHTPHGATGVTPLWNRQLGAGPYTGYTSATFNQPTVISDRSKLCLSCHDGTIAMGQTAATGDLNVGKMATVNTLGADLSRDHPIGFQLPIPDDGELKAGMISAPTGTGDPTVKLFNNAIECVTCHDPHVPNNDPIAKKFLVRSNESGSICASCHDTTRGQLNGWSLSTHSQATNQPVMGSTLEYGSVAANGCMSCHTSHKAPGTGPSLMAGAEEKACATCHSGTSQVTPAPPDIISELDKGYYQHPITDPSVAGLHTPNEKLPVQNGRHSECADCHNPHATQPRNDASVAPSIQPTMLGVTGVSSPNSTALSGFATNQYEVCLKCHAGSSNKPQTFGYDSVYGRTPYRQSMQGMATQDAYNEALAFKSTVSRHNVTQAQKGGDPSLRDAMLDVNGNPTLRSPKTEAQMYCTDCHNSDRTKSDGGTGPSGPHASKYAHILERRYEVNTPAANAGDPVGNLMPYVSGITGPYAMCDKCHDLDNKVLSGDTVFGKHRLHVVDGQMACSSCHSSHGIQGNDQNPDQHGHLIDPDLAIVKPLSSTTPMISTSSRTCNLVCHGQTHSNVTY